MQSKTAPTDHHVRLSLWAADLADSVLDLFLQEASSDRRPQTAIAAARSWAAGDLSVADALKAARGALAAARECKSPSARAAAQCAGHAAATACVARHADAAEGYMNKALRTAPRDDPNPAHTVD